jgi:diaminopimelate decarboxylase
MNTGFQTLNGELCADGVALSDVAREYGTPTYVYSAGEIEKQYAALAGAMRAHLPANRQPLLCFACKANSNIGILAYLRSLGSGLEIVSGGELARGLKAGFDPAKIVFTGVGKTRDEIVAGLDAGIHQFNVESIPELIHINAVAADMNKIATVVFRLNPNVTGGGHHKISTGRKRDKFGLGDVQLKESFGLLSTLPHIRCVGLSMHIGSQVSTVESFKTAFEKLPALVRELRAQDHAIERLDIGGGFPIIYKDEQLLDLSAYAAWVRDIISPLDTEIIMEPGRYLVGNAGVLLTKVLYVKETPDRRFLILDAAMNDLIRPAMYDAYHGIEPVRNKDAAPVPYDVVGPVCETGDTFTTDRTIPAMAPGDLAVIRSAGAYGASMASNYNTRPLIPEIMTQNGQHACLRPRQTITEILSREHIPDWINAR